MFLVWCPNIKEPETLKCPACKAPFNPDSFYCQACGRDWVRANRLDRMLNLALTAAVGALCWVTWLWMGA